MHATNRRDFLKAAAILGTTAAVGSEFVLPAMGADDAGGSWTTFRGNAGRTGATEESGPGSNVTTERSFDMNGGMYTTEPVVADGTVYMAVTTALTPSSSEGYVAAYDPDADETVWKRDDISRPGTPTVGDGTVYFGTRGSEDASGTGFFAVDSGTGETKWHVEESNRMDNPLVADGGLFADVSGGIARFDPDTGDVVWKTEAASGVTCFGDGALFCGNGVALNADDGSVRWDVSGDGDVLQTVADGRVFSTENRSGEYAIKARSVEDGRELWTHTLAMSGYWFGNRLTVANGCVFYRINDAIQALEVENGYDAWTYEADASLAGAVSVAGDTLYAGGRADPETETGDAVVLALNTTTGELDWRHEFGEWDTEEYGPAANSPVVVNGKVYTATYPLGSTTDWMYTRYGDFHVLGNAEDPTTTPTEETTTEETETTTEEPTTGKTTTTSETTTTATEPTTTAGKTTTTTASENTTSVSTTDTTTTKTTTPGTTMSETTTTTTTTSGTPGATETTGSGGNGNLTSTTTGTTTTSDGQPGFGLLTALGGFAGVGAYLRSKIERDD
ncbi:PQQ-binding-like beta-propeller repeat protein [Haladaptatus sp. DYF46]|uniref:outer membrane protein assembly factor BamB family protein n=1 Tax=Haladaptatus sp. DYF46 TaxID=2886041 RepID=UPI001E3ED94D|nr:PQQ-binding-like beta-propeller repeat protein [Haladaptatus sp. DYF46]